MTLPESPAFRPLTGIYEPSAVQQLPDGRFLVVEDEQEHPFSFFKLHPDGGVKSSPLEVPQTHWWSWSDPFEELRKLDDLEGLTLARDGHLYAITSHSRTGEGEEKRAREKLVRFRIEGDRIAAGKVYGGLKEALVAVHPVLAEAARVKDVKGSGGLNIEALGLSPDQTRLLIGFRSPLQGGRALIAYLDNSQGLFERNEKPRIAPQLAALDLGGQGLRGLSYVPALGAYLLLSGPVAKEQVQFGLWLWRGRPEEAPRRVLVDGLPGFEHAEGVTQALVGGATRILIVSDDGSRTEGRFARYLLLAPEQLLVGD